MFSASNQLGKDLALAFSPVAVLCLWASPAPLVEGFCQGLTSVEGVVWQDLLVHSASLVALRRGVMMVAVGIVRECDGRFLIVEVDAC